MASSGTNGSASKNPPSVAPISSATATAAAGSSGSDRRQASGTVASGSASASTTWSRAARRAEQHLELARERQPGGQQPIASECADLPH